MIYNVADDSNYKPIVNYDRYEFVFPSCYYKDISMQRNSDDPSRYCIKLLGAHKGVQIEPIVVLRKVVAGKSWNPNQPIRDSEASLLAEIHFEEVCKLVEKEIGVKAKFVENAQKKVCTQVAQAKKQGTAYFEWHRETNAFITACEGSAGLAGAQHLLQRLEGYVELVGKIPEEVPLVGEKQKMIMEIIRKSQEARAVKAAVPAPTCSCTCLKHART
ncbi:hypothetical protein LTR97_000660 [Elasticomyces elasticus]|uniref:Uncharacterized protein n=1 Tax=Elasticomyces elasticus TaxID=574655 RepID=A0AAN7WKJ1_9PEZI|nr:hypothetical protein LTR97_000660 [Elasticomyces elasticus]